MSLLFQHPAFWGLLALAGVPVLVHLLSRAKPPHYRFSNIEFLRKVLRLTSRFRKPVDWLLLALRTLALLALALAFLGPLLLSKKAALPGQKRTVVLLIDRSASMGAQEGAASRMEAACAAAGLVLDDEKPELANIVWIDASPDAVFPEPAPNREFLADSLARATARPEPGALDAAMDLALRQLRDAPGRKELHIISDFQASVWKNFAPVIPEGVDVHVIPVAKSDVANVAVTSLTALPASPVAGQQLVAQVRVANHSGEARRISLTLDAGGSRQSQPLDLPAQGEAEAAFTVRCSASGLMPMTAEIDADGFPGDNRRHSVVRVRDSLRLAIASPADHPYSQAMIRVGHALTWLDVVPGVDPLHPPACDVLALPAWDGNAGELRNLAGKGTAVIVTPAPNAPPLSVLTLFQQSAEAAPGMGGVETSGTGWEAGPEGNAALFKLFAGGEFGNPLAGKYKSRPRLPVPANAQILARFNDGKPALYQYPSLPILVDLLSYDPATSTRVAEPAFLPAAAETLLRLLPQSAAESFEVAPGETLAWTNTAADSSVAPVLEGPDGAPQAIVAAGQTWHAEAPAVPGIYRWLVSGQPVHVQAVNFPESESLLAPLPAPPPLGNATLTDPSAIRRAALDHGLPLWPWMIAAALLLMAAESAVTSRLAHRPSRRTSSFPA